MSTSLLIHDSAAAGHTNWACAQLAAGRAQGVIIDPFHTPLTSRPRHCDAAQVVDRVREHRPGVEILLDPSTHAALLQGTNLRANYDTWSLWPDGFANLANPLALRSHVEAVLAVQHSLGIAPTAPTRVLDHPTGAAADCALALADEARRQQPDVRQALVGRRSFWAAGHALDDYLGRLVTLRAPQWHVTVLRDNPDFPPDLTDRYSTAGLARSVHSLARRASVSLGHGADVAALPALAAGADGLGTGWYSKQRVCSPSLFQTGGGGLNRRWCPHPGLLARLRGDVAEALDDRDADFAREMRGQRDLPSNEAERRDQHLDAVAALVAHLDAAGANAAARVPAARRLLQTADDAWNRAIALGLNDLGRPEQTRWITELRAGFELYARCEEL
ncbi:hypothetical protein [Pseudonocardia sp. SID8383]|uniref:hypothetical protein n=1 Tax=Pseudonocardia sp. SID8383 TaxID=2690363 RepID=UPI00136D5547|nr:hypothetical protein [Pseudonocardia sp. SID8383]MYW71073.1 hypothetical protein [Pseudonocardia sp. SID8383]